VLFRSLYIDAPENMEEMEEIIVAEIEKIDTDKESVDLD
jgi:hypothetical protein